MPDDVTFFDDFIKLSKGGQDRVALKKVKTALGKFVGGGGKRYSGRYAGHFSPSLYSSADCVCATLAGTLASTSDELFDCIVFSGCFFLFLFFFKNSNYNEPMIFPTVALLSVKTIHIRAIHFPKI